MTFQYAFHSRPFSGNNNSSGAAGTAAAGGAGASTATAEDVESLEKALGIDFHDPNGVVQRQLLAK